MKQFILLINLFVISISTSQIYANGSGGATGTVGDLIENEFVAVDLRMEAGVIEAFTAHHNTFAALKGGDVLELAVFESNFEPYLSKFSYKGDMESLGLPLIEVQGSSGYSVVISAEDLQKYFRPNTTNSMEFVLKN